MGNAYRSDEAALRLQVDALREELEAASEDAARQQQLRLELERTLAELKRARLSEAERSQAARRVAVRGLVAGLVLALVAATGGYAFYRWRTAGRTTAAAAWFDSARPHCNSVEAEAYLRSHPAPAEAPAGVGYTAACYALAHRIDDARSVLVSADPGIRALAVRTVFEVVHPVADAGDDVAAGPVMELVVEFWPDNYMAVFHAGMAAYEKEDDERALRHLERFMTMYRNDDIWRQRATTALDVLRSVRDGKKVVRPKIEVH
jgi:cytochrome c-type biogenesis protein CcmH/NrfG